MNIRVLTALTTFLLALSLAGTSVEAQPAQALSAKLADGRQRAFPTAEGFGAGAKGGRGGAVIYVTNLDESGPGSLRACVEASGPRTCIFRVGGTIQLDKTSLVITNPFITIAGETAPGGGIAIRNGSEQIRPSIEIKTNDVIIRFLRLRPGPHTVKACCAGALGMYTTGARDIMLDHISTSWGSDETIDSEGASNFTFQWGIVGEPLLNGGPGKRNRARNMLFTKGGNLTVHHTLFTTGKFRNPQVKMQIPDSVADIVNNVMYSPEWQYVVTFGDEWVHTRANVVGNYKIKGVNEKDDHLVFLFEESGLGHSIYLRDNYDEPYRVDAAAPDDLVIAPELRKYVVTTRFPAPEVRTTSPQQAYEDVLANAGATRPMRDAVDTRLIEEVKNRNGKLLKSDPAKVGGWPQLESGTPYPDNDSDGVSDEWEKANGLNPADGMDGKLDKDGDGWTNLEEFLHNLAGDP